MNYFLESAGCCWFIFIVCIAIVTGQFPLKCAENLKNRNGTCCPIPDGSSEVCGGPKRGRCAKIKDYNEPTLLSNLTRDDRVNWPKKFFQNACQCFGNFDGPDCTKCAFGFSGQECNNKRIYIRKDATELTARERKLLHDVLDFAKKKPSEWGVLNLTGSIDPVTSENLQNLIPVSIYDFFTYMHVYAARFTYTPDRTSCYTFELHIDSAHRGSGFLTWHRLHLLQLERELRLIAKSEFGDEDFALPYWDWVDDGQTCEVCTNDLFGKENETAEPGRMESYSPFSQWKGLCPLMPGCPSCDPAADNGYVYRRFGKKTTKKLPTRKEVDFAMSRPLYDTPPFDFNSDDRSFRAVVEGFANSERSGIIDEEIMHNRVHMVGGGLFYDLLSAPGDPLFIGHHVFIDKLFQMWLRKKEPSIHEFPAEGAPSGHNRDQPIMPFFPPFYTSAMFFVDSRNLGYDYDYIVLQSDRKATSNSWSDVIAWVENHPDDAAITLIVGYVLLFLAIVAVVSVLISIACRYKKKKVQVTDVTVARSRLSSSARVSQSNGDVITPGTRQKTDASVALTDLKSSSDAQGLPNTKM